MGLNRDTERGRSVTKIGNSLGVTIPAAWRNDLNVDTDDSVDQEVDFEERTVTLHF